MKKKICLILIMFILSITNVYALNVEVEDININNHSDTITLGDYGITGNTINPDITFNKVNDYVTYEIKFKNNDKYTIESIIDNNTNEYIKTSYSYDKDLSKPIYITLTYIKETKELSLDNINITIKLLSNKGKEEVLEVKIDKSNDILKEGPGTGILISATLSLISILLIGYLYLAYYRKKQNVNTMILMLGLLLVPVSLVFADSEKISLIINTENIKVYNSPWKIESQSVPGTLSVGDELSVDTEHFYVVSSDEDKTVLLAKYNLNVGDNKNPNVEEGIQNESVIGYNGDMNNVYGAIPFTNTSYWSEENNLNKYGTDYPIYVYDENSNLYEYIENYIVELKKLGLENISGRLMTYNESAALGCSINNRSCSNAPNWVYQTTYWLGTAYDEDYMYGIVATYGLNAGTYDGDYIVGVRPVIEVQTSDIGL